MRVSEQYTTSTIITVSTLLLLLLSLITVIIQYAYHIIAVEILHAEHTVGRQREIFIL